MIINKQQISGQQNPLGEIKINNYKNQSIQIQDTTNYDAYQMFYDNEQNKNFTEFTPQAFNNLIFQPITTIQQKLNSDAEYNLASCEKEKLEQEQKRVQSAEPRDTYIFQIKPKSQDAIIANKVEDSLSSHFQNGQKINQKQTQQNESNTLQLFTDKLSPQQKEKQQQYVQPTNTISLQLPQQLQKVMKKKPTAKNLKKQEILMKGHNQNQQKKDLITFSTQFKSDGLQEFLEVSGDKNKLLLVPVRNSKKIQRLMDLLENKNGDLENPTKSIMDQSQQLANIEGNSTSIDNSTIKLYQNCPKLETLADKESKQQQPIANSSPYDKQIDVDNINQQGIEEQNQDDREQKVVAACKICLDVEQTKETGKMLTPCLCTGTCQFIHEECLKEWILSKHLRQRSRNNLLQIDFNKITCEICQYKYKMTAIQGPVFNPRNACKRGVGNLLMSLFSLIFSSSLIYLIYYFLTFQFDSTQTQNSSDKPSNSSSNPKSSENNQEDNNTFNSLKSGYRYGIIVCAGIIALLFIIVFFISFREAFYVRQIMKWEIYNHDHLINENNKQSKNEAKNKKNGYNKNKVVPQEQGNHQVEHLTSVIYGNQRVQLSQLPQQQ